MQLCRNSYFHFNSRANSLFVSTTADLSLCIHHPAGKKSQSMAVKVLINGFILLSLAMASAVADPNNESKPMFTFSWADNKDTYIAGDTATINIRVLDNFDPDSNKSVFSPTVSVNGKPGNSTFISGLALNFGQDIDTWTISFVPILAGVFDVLITDESFAVLDSSLHFTVLPGKMHPGVSIVSWMDNVNEFTAGMMAVVLVLPKDAFGNTVGLPNAELDSTAFFNVSESYSNGSAVAAFNVTPSGWNDHGYFRIELTTSSAGNLLLHVQRDSLTLRGSPLPFTVTPGPLVVSKCAAEWKYGTNVSQLDSKVEMFIYQLDLYQNLVTGFFPFDAEIVEKSTHLSIPVADLNFREFSPGIQLLEFGAMEPGDFLLMVYDAKHDTNISNVPFEFTVLPGSCDGSKSIVNGSGLNSSIAGEEARFTVYLKDKYQYPSPVEPRMLLVKITRETKSYAVFPIIYPLEAHEGTMPPWHMSYNAIGNLEAASAPSVNQNDSSTGTSLAYVFDVVYTPKRCGVYDILVLCGNIPLNGGHSFRKEVKAGEVNISLSGVVKYVSKTEKLVQNEVIVQLMDSFSNPVLSMQPRLKLEIDSINKSDFTIWTFMDNNDGSYTSQYMVNNVGSYELCVLFNDDHLSPCPCGINAYSSEYFPKAYDDSVSLWEDESLAFDALANDYFAGENTTIVGFSNPHYGTVLQNGVLFRYTPYKGFYGNDSFSYTIRDINENTATASVSITVLSIPPQVVSLPTNLRAIEDIMSPKFGGFNGFEIAFPDLAKNISITVSANSGIISLSPMKMQFWQPIWGSLVITRGGREAKELTLSGPVEVVNVVLQSIQYLGDENFYGKDTITVAARNKDLATYVDVTIFVESVNDPPLIRTPEYIVLEESDDGNESLIFKKGKDNFAFSVDDPDLINFPGKRSDFVVSLSMEVTSGVLEAILPVELVNTTELRLKTSYQWQPLQTFVTISQHFVVKARGVRFQGPIDECNNILQQLKYYGTDYGAVLKIMVNDMGNYGIGCFPDCAENVSKPLQAEANVNLIKRRPLSSRTSHALGFIIILEFVVVVSLGAVLLFYTCKCAISLINHDTNKDTDHAYQTSVSQHMRKNRLAGKAATSTRSCPTPVESSGTTVNYRQRRRARRRFETHTTRNSNQNGAAPSFRSLQIGKNQLDMSP